MQFPTCTGPAEGKIPVLEGNQRPGTLFNKLILQLKVTKWEKDVLIRTAVLPFIQIKGMLLMRRSSGIPGRHANKRTHPQTDTHWDALAKLACIQQQNDNSVVGYYEWEGFSRSRASNTSSLTCFAPHKHVRRAGTLHAYIPAHITTETADTDTSAREKIFKVSFTCCERCSGCDHMMMDGEIRGKKKEPFSPINSTVAFSPTPASMLLAMCLCRSVCLFLSLAGGWERGEMGKKKWGKGGEESAAVLSSHLIKDHFSRHTLKGKCERANVCVCEGKPEIIKGKMQQKYEFYKVFQSNCSPEPY